MFVLGASDAVAGCASAPQPTVQPPPRALSAEPTSGETPSGPEPVGTRRVRGPGWSLAVPTAWQEQVDGRGVTQWRTLTPPGQPGHRTLSVEIAHGTETFAQMVTQLPAAYRERGGEARHRPRTHRGQQVAEFEIQFPERVPLIPTYYAMWVEGTWGMLVTCGGESDPGLEAACREVQASAWFGVGPNAVPAAPASAGRTWMGARGRYVQVPAAWHPMSETTLSGDNAMGVADEGEHHAVVVHFLDDVPGAPAAVLARARDNIAADATNTIVRTQPSRQGQRHGMTIDAVRRGTAVVATTVVQWMLEAGPGAFLSINCGGVASDVAAHPEVCAAIMDSFTREPSPGGL